MNITKTAFGLVLITTFLVLSCSVKDEPIENTNQTEILPTEEIDELDTVKVDNTSLNDSITVMVIPCSNGYEYNLKMGDLNPSLNKYLKADDRVILMPFPLKKMLGSGYLGVYDKKHCSGILEKVDVDFLIMTRMKGMELTPINTDTRNWGYETKILNVSKMLQFPGIKAENLKSFDQIDSDIQQKMDVLIELITESTESK